MFCCPLFWFSYKVLDTEAPMLALPLRLPTAPYGGHMGHFLLSVLMLSGSAPFGNNTNLKPLPSIETTNRGLPQPRRPSQPNQPAKDHPGWILPASPVSSGGVQATSKHLTASLRVECAPGSRYSVSQPHRDTNDYRVPVRVVPTAVHTINKVLQRAAGQQQTPDKTDCWVLTSAGCACGGACLVCTL